MAQVKQVTAEGLHWVREELGISLERVRSLVEGYLEAPANPLPLQRSLVELHQIRGTLRMIQCDGAALLAEEMKGAVQDLLADVDNAPEKAFEVLLGATLQLSDYLDVLAAGERDNALVFLPLINELRVARGAGVLSESVLFARYAQLETPPADTEAEIDAEAVRRLAAQRLPAFNAALLRVLRDQSPADYLGRLSGIAEEMQRTAGETRGGRVFGAAAGLLEAVGDGGVGLELDVKRLLGRVGQYLKAVAEGDDESLREAPQDLLYGLVYFAGGADSDGERVAALRRDYRLDELLPDAAALDRLRGRLRGPNTGLVAKLSAAIKEDIESVKNSIDLVVRAGDRAAVRIEDTVAATRRIGDTLAMLGLDMLQRVVLNQARAIEGLAEEGVRDQDAWMEVALALLRVEESLDKALARHMRGQADAPEAAGDDDTPHHEIDTGGAAIYREALVNLSRVKTLIPDFIDAGEPALLSEAARLLREVEAGLQVLQRDDGVALLERLRTFVASRDMIEARTQPARMLALADAVAGVEYYLEALAAGQAEPAAAYERAVDRIERLGSASAETVAVEETSPAPSGEAGETADPDEVDPEIRDIFLEEAGEVLEALRRDVPAWSGNLGDTARLAEIRRAFHTLKGSGRMAGAGDIGAFGWSLERLLNRCLEGAVEAGAEVAATVGRAVEVLPGLIEDFRAGRRPEGIAPVIAEADRLAGVAGEGDDAGQYAESELFRVFRGDARGHIGHLREVAAETPPVAVATDTVRALHTLKGSSEAVHAQAIARLARVFEHYADASRAAGRPFDVDDLALLDEAATAFDAAIDALDRGNEPDAAAIDALAARVEAARAGLPQEAVESASDEALRVVFTNEACDLVDAIQGALDDWRANPADDHHPSALKAICHKLKGSARTAEAHELGEVAQALEQRAAGYIEPGRHPDAAEFDRLEQVVDGLYDMLDGLRQSGRAGEAGPLLRILSGTAEGERGPPADTTGPAEVDQATTVDASDDAGAVDVTETGESATPPTAGVPGPAEAAADGADADGDRDAAGHDGADEPVPDADVPATEDSDADEADPEVLAIFTAEAGELMEALESDLERWRLAPDDDEPREALMRTLHTLKGSARMAGVESIGDECHELETRLAGAGRADADHLERLREAADGIHRTLDLLARGESPAPETDALPSTGPEDRFRTGAASASGDADAADATVPDAVDETVPPAPAAAEPPSPESDAPRVPVEFDERLFWEPETEGADTRAGLPETARVPVARLDDMLNEAGEISIVRARLAQQNAELQFQLREMQQTTSRLREQLRKLDMETEAQILARHEPETNRYDAEFDPLEMDRYSALHELSRGLAESATDLASLHGSMSDLAEQDESLLVQQSRINTSLQQGLMRTLMVPFSRQTQRLERIVRQVAREHGRDVGLELDGVEAELDRNVLERIVAPMEHLLRNAVVHGIEPGPDRVEAGKPRTGTIGVRLFREGTQLVVEVRDDGRGLDTAAIRDKAVEMGLLASDAGLGDADLAQFIFEPGFSTARELTQTAGRGVGLDVVNAEIKQLGGTLTVDSGAGAGTRFTIRLPLTLAISQALLVEVGEERYAVPLGSIEGVTRAPYAELEKHLDSPEAGFEYGGQHYRVRSLGQLLDVPSAGGEGEEAPVNAAVLLVRTGDRRTAFVVDGMLGSREIVVKPVGPQVATVPAVAGATIMADGEVVLILDVAALMQMQVRRAMRERVPAEAVAAPADERPTVMVVDDSITIRRVSERFLSRHGFAVSTAKDGMDALAKLQSQPPDVVLLDIEMPRIDGFELATYMRNSETLRDTPIIMITSRSGDKHRRRAEAIGVDRFVTKPYQEQELLDEIRSVLGTAQEASRG
ncbi:CheA signal transduction histidine kinase [Salinisphaera sp. PC39]|uniref:Hpt domain-containing protein n=1 Tax=Salinisphaera sp. PC39 TaxID=1304156 RepID=UPI00333F5BAA